MKIICRNFTRLLSVGAFGAHCPLEAMSEFKWNRLLSIAEGHGVSDFIYSGLVQTGGKTIPCRILEDAKAKMRPLKDICNEDDKNYGYSVKRQVQKFSSIYLNKRYNKLVFNEIHSIDTSINSLILLNKLIDNINALLDYGADIRKLAELGSYLRTYGNKIDFVKVENWIKTLKISNICNFIAWHLVFLFRFENSELPFLHDVNDKYLSSIQRALEQNMSICTISVKPNIKRSGSQVSINPMHKFNAHPLEYVRLFPVEAVSRYVSNIFKSLSNIDE